MNTTHYEITAYSGYYYVQAVTLTADGEYPADVPAIAKVGKGSKDRAKITAALVKLGPWNPAIA